MVTGGRGHGRDELRGRRAAAAAPAERPPPLRPSPAEPAYLIVNADDYGYFPCVSQGILAAARDGVVTATGVLATAPALDQQLGWLNACPQLDLGAHLDLTSGTPLSLTMRDRLRRFGGQFPSKERLAGALLTAAVTVADVREEWQRQIERCLARGLTLRFLNSHEHVHLWPTLFPLPLELAEEHGITEVRHPQGEVPLHWTAGSIARNLIIQSLAWLNRRHRDRATIPCLGVGESGRLGFGYLERLVATLAAGHTYELMCHPGRHDPAVITDRRLRAYHHWEQELDLLTSAATRTLLAESGVRVIGYRELRP